MLNFLKLTALVWREVDRTAPTIYITSSTNGGWTKGESVPNVVASDGGSGLSRVMIKYSFYYSDQRGNIKPKYTSVSDIDGDPHGWRKGSATNLGGQSSYSVPADHGDLVNNAYYINAYAVDMNGNSAIAVEGPFYYDNGVPDISLSCSGTSKESTLEGSIGDFSTNAGRSSGLNRPKLLYSWDRPAITEWDNGSPKDLTWEGIDWSKDSRAGDPFYREVAVLHVYRKWQF